jgi:hypothetical protein
MEDWLFQDQRIHPFIYDVMVQGVKERTVSIRGGISWPQVDDPGYFALVAQLEKKSSEGDLRYLAFYEGQAPLASEFFKKIASACNKWRIDTLCHGGRIHVMSSGQRGGAIRKPGKDDELSFSDELSNYLQKRKARYEIVQFPSIGPSWRSEQPDFLVSLVRNHIAAKTLLVFQLSDNKTPLLLERIRNTDMESNILDSPELKALAHVMDDFGASPWRPRSP